MASLHGQNSRVLINNAVPVDLKSVAKACRSLDNTFPKGLVAVRSGWCGSSAVL